MKVTNFSRLGGYFTPSVATTPEQQNKVLNYCTHVIQGYFMGARVAANSVTLRIAPKYFHNCKGLQLPDTINVYLHGADAKQVTEQMHRMNVNAEPKIYLHCDVGVTANLHEIEDFYNVSEMFHNQLNNLLW